MSGKHRGESLYRSQVVRKCNSVKTSNNRTNKLKDFINNNNNNNSLPLFMGLAKGKQGQLEPRITSISTR